MIEATRLVLESLRAGKDLAQPSEQLSREVALSQAQLWKHVTTLRERGYSIEGEAGKGYRLLAIPDRLYAEEIGVGLETQWLGPVSYTHLTLPTKA